MFERGSSVKRHLSLFLIAACVLLSACSLPTELPTSTPTPLESLTPTPVPPTQTPTLTLTPTVTPLPDYLQLGTEELSGVEISLWHALRDDPKSLLDELVTKFNAENTYGITVRTEFDISIEGMSERVDDALENGDLPQLLIADNTYLRQWESEGMAVMDLSDYAEHTQMSLAAQGIDPVIDAMLAQDTVDGELRAMPLWHDPAFLFYNRTWAQELGFENIPGAFAEFAEQCRAANKAVDQDDETENNGTGGWILQTDVPTVMSWILNFGASADSMDAFWGQDAEGDFVKTAEWMRGLYDEGGIWNSRLKDPYDYFANRYALFYSGTYSDAARQLNAFAGAETYSMDNWDIIPYPRKTKDGQPVDPRFYSTAVSAAIPESDARSQYAAWIFLSWLLRDDHAAELALTAEAWPVQDNDVVTRLYQNSGKNKLFLTLAWRDGVMPYPVNADWNIDSLVLADGFEHVFSLTTKTEDIPTIWEQIGSSITEIKEYLQSR